MIVPLKEVRPGHYVPTSGITPNPLLSEAGIGGLIHRHPTRFSSSGLPVLRAFATVSRYDIEQ
jgi:hypothetical protein